MRHAVSGPWISERTHVSDSEIKRRDYLHLIADMPGNDSDDTFHLYMPEWTKNVRSLAATAEVAHLLHVDGREA